MITNIDEYVDFTDTTAIYPKDCEEEYITAGLQEELGEVAGIFKRWVRDAERDVSKEKITELRDRFLAEIGDVLWYLARHAKFYNFDLYLAARSALSDWDAFSGDGFEDADYIAIGESLQFANIYAANINGAIVSGKTENFTLERHVSQLLFELVFIGHLFDFTLKDAYMANFEKLSARKQSNTLKGKGDNR